MRRRILTALVVLAVSLAVLYAAGPRVPVDTRITFDASVIGDDPAGYLDRSESRVPGIRDGLEKEIVWADPMTHVKTPISIIYIHGFSASKGEVRPLPDQVAEELGANLFYTRLKGHGQDGAAMDKGRRFGRLIAKLVSASPAWRRAPADRSRARGRAPLHRR
ncbi:hypothetical protein [Allomesorhizobium camelthorni]|uniref:hypothetical protein n=1 Tax=Allomesorhizobium camelthorni TaxID=475069 RepID=UPI00197F68B3|nr:hypothetical protein [Mesorhizobium camelthorni]